MLDQSTRGYAAAMAGTTLGVLVTGLIGSVGVAEITGTSTSVVLTLDQDGVMELGGVLLFPYLGVVLLLGGPVGCWLALRLRQAAGQHATAVASAPMSLASFLVLSSLVGGGPDDPVVLPYALVIAAAASAGVARAVVLTTQRLQA